MQATAYDDITRHKSIPIVGAVLYGGGDGSMVRLSNVMKDSNIVIDPITGKTGYGGDRIIAFKYKVSIYFNNIDVGFKNQINQLAGLSEGALAVPGGAIDGAVIIFEAAGEVGLRHLDLGMAGSSPAQLSYSWVTADSFGKYGLVLTGVMRSFEGIPEE